jgi:hypothetical protein
VDPAALYRKPGDQHRRQRRLPGYGPARLRAALRRDLRHRRIRIRRFGCNANAEHYSHADTHTDADIYAYANCDADGHSNSDRNADTYSDAHRQHDPDQDTDANVAG